MILNRRILVVIPARGGSKGLPQKNVKPLLGKPLIYYTIDSARSLFPDNQICVSTDDPGIKKVVEEYNLSVPFLRPDELSTDTAGTYEVLLHALEYYESNGNTYDFILLLQPTTPIRKKEHIEEIIKLVGRIDFDMVASVSIPKDSPYFNMFEEEEKGYLRKSKENNYTRRQDAPKVYAMNGSIYLINVESLKKRNINKFEKVVKFVMEESIYNIDIDTKDDWILAEMQLQKYK